MWYYIGNSRGFGNADLQFSHNKNILTMSWWFEWSLLATADYALLHSVAFAGQGAGFLPPEGQNRFVFQLLTKENVSYQIIFTASKNIVPSQNYHILKSRKYSCLKTFNDMSLKCPKLWKGMSSSKHKRR